MTFLDEILAHKRLEIRPLQAQRAALRRAARQSIFPVRDFYAALAQKPRLSVIAEIKRASPSEGLLMADRDPLELLRAYERGGASAISVVTDERYFGGSLDLLRQVASHTELPVLRKEFIVDTLQIDAAREAGASAVLLLASVLSEEELRRFRESAESLGMQALVEVHDEPELERALASGATIVGVNNRDLKTFQINLNTTFHLASRMPSDVLLVSESGIGDRVDFGRLQGIAHAVLVGTSLIRAEDPVHVLDSWIHPARPCVKVCGIQDVETVRACEAMGVEFIGLNFVPESPRCISLETAKSILKAVKDVRAVGVFKDQPLSFILEMNEALELDFVQLHGQESAEFCAKVPIPVIKSFFPGEQPFSGVIPLLDLPKSSARVISMSPTEAPTVPYFLAGGFTPENVATALPMCVPFVVDVARGVEKDGHKDLSKIQSFLNALIR